MIGRALDSAEGTPFETAKALRMRFPFLEEAHAQAEGLFDFDFREARGRRPQQARLEDAAWMRVYAHQTHGMKPQGERTDFTETVYWNAGKSAYALSGNGDEATLRATAERIAAASL